MEENKRDSSAPNSPELTEMSGEQAEERTAREGRAMKWLVAEVTPRDIGVQVTWQFTDEETAELLADYAESECSRLASRVEELEKALHIVIGRVRLRTGLGRLCGDCGEKWHTPDRCELAFVESVLAGAHAEEKGL